MKAKRRQELHTNTLADWLGEKIQHVKPYVPWIVGGLIAVVVASVIISVRSSRQSSELTQAWNEFNEARGTGLNAAVSNTPVELTDSLKRLETVADEFSDGPLGVFAQLSIADIHLASGQGQLRSNQITAQDHFKKAAADYEAVANTSDDPTIKNRALYCLGKSQEWQRRFTQAKKTYKQVEGPYREDALARLDQLSRKSTVEFYDKFADWKPKPPPDVPDSRYPELELDNDGPAVTGEIDYRQYLDATAIGLDTAAFEPGDLDEPSPDGAADDSATKGDADGGDAGKASDEQTTPAERDDEKTDGAPAGDEPADSDSDDGNKDTGSKDTGDSEKAATDKDDTKDSATDNGESDAATEGDGTKGGEPADDTTIDDKAAEDKGASDPS